MCHSTLPSPLRSQTQLGSSGCGSTAGVPGGHSELAGPVAGSSVPLGTGRSPPSESYVGLLLRSRQSMLRAGDKAAEGEPELAAIVAKLRGLSRAVNELLRHFWSSFPLSSSHRKEKVRRMNKALGAQYDRLEKARAAMDPSQRLLARPLIGQLLSACDAAFTKYDANLDKLGPAEAGGGEK